MSCRTLGNQNRWASSIHERGAFRYRENARCTGAAKAGRQSDHRATRYAVAAAAERLREQYEQMRLLQSLLYALRSEILYARSYLEEAFAKIGESAPEPYRGWLLGMSEIMRQKSGVPFCQIWSGGIQESLRESGLEQEEKDKLSEIGKRLGNADMEAQIRSLDLYLEELKKSMEEKREGMKTRIQLCHCLGVMSGIFLTSCWYKYFADGNRKSADKRRHPWISVCYLK